MREKPDSLRYNWYKCGREQQQKARIVDGNPEKRKEKNACQNNTLILRWYETNIEEQ